MSALTSMDAFLLRDVEADGDIRDDPQWRALLGQGRKRRRIKHLPGQHNQESHGNDHGVDVIPGGKLRGAGRIDLEPGERLLRSDRTAGDGGRAWLAVTEKDGKRSLRIGLGNATFGTRHDHGGPWRAGPDRTAEIDEERAELRGLMDDLEREIEDLENDPDADPARLAELRAQLEGYEDAGADSDVTELPGGYTAMLDENGARRLRETLAKALDDGEKLQAELDKPYQELDRLTLERDKLKRNAMGRKFTAEEDAEWDRLTAEISRAQAELDPSSGPERPESGYWTIAEGSIPGQWADVHYDIYLDDPDVGVEVHLGAVPHGSEMDFQDMSGAEMTASFSKGEADQLVRLLAKMESGDQPKSAKRYNEHQLRDPHTGEWVDTTPGDGGGKNPLDKLGLAKRIHLKPGEKLLSSRKIRTDDDSFDFLAAEVDTPSGRQVRLGIAVDARHWAAGPNPKRTQRLAEIHAEIDQLEERDDLTDAEEARLDELNEERLGLNDDDDYNRTAVLTPAAVTELRTRLAEGVDAGRAHKKAFDAFWESPQAQQLNEQSEALRRTVASITAKPSFARTDEEKRRLDEVEEQVSQLWEGVDAPDVEAVFVEGHVPGGPEGDIHYRVAGYDNGEGGWDIDLGIKPPGADDSWTIGSIADDKSTFEGSNVKGLLKALQELESGDQPKGYRGHLVKHPGHSPQSVHGNHHHGGVDLIPPMAGLPVLNEDEYTKNYGDMLDERTLGVDEDGVQLSARFFELGDAHVVLDLPGGRRQVMAEFNGSDGMRALADDIRAMQHEKLPDREPTGDLVADVNSREHDFYVAKDDLGNIWLRADEQAEDDYLELDEDEAWELFDALNDLADSYDAEFGDGEEDEAEVEVVAGGKSRRKHFPGRHNQSSRRGGRVRRKHLPGQHNQESHGHHGAGPALDKLKLTGRMDLLPGEEVAASGKVSPGVVYALVAEPNGHILHIGLVDPSDEKNWRARPLGGTVSLGDQDIEQLRKKSGEVAEAALDAREELRIAAEEIDAFDGFNKFSYHSDRGWSFDDDVTPEQQELIKQHSHMRGDKIFDHGVLASGSEGDLVYDIVGDDGLTDDEGTIVRLAVRPSDASDSWSIGDGSSGDPKEFDQDEFEAWVKKLGKVLNLASAKTGKSATTQPKTRSQAMSTKTMQVGQFRVKNADLGEFSAVLATLGVIDSDGDVTDPGAFDGSDFPISAYGHKSWEGALPVGVGRVKEVGNQIIVEGQFFMDTTHGRDTFTTVKRLGPLGQWSYGYDVLDHSMGMHQGKSVRFLKKLKVHEASPVLVGAGVGTRTLGTKGNSMRINRAGSGTTSTAVRAVKGAIPVHETKTASRLWDNARTVKALPEDSLPSELRTVFGWVDPDGDPEDLTSYKMAHHHGLSGPANLRACLIGIAELNQGTSDIPDADRKGVYDHLAAHIRDADRDPPELRVKGSGPAKQYDQLLEGLATLSGLIDGVYSGAARQEKGRGLSKVKSELLGWIGDDLTRLKALLSQPAEPEIAQPSDDELASLAAASLARISGF